MWPHFKKLPIQPKSRTTIEKSKFRFSWNYDFWATIKIWTWKRWMKVCLAQNCCHLFVCFPLFDGRLLNLLRIALHLSRELERCSVPFPTICTPTTYLPSSATLQPTNLLFHVCWASRLLPGLDHTIRYSVHNSAVSEVMQCWWLCCIRCWGCGVMNLRSPPAARRGRLQHHF